MAGSHMGLSKLQRTQSSSSLWWETAFEFFSFIASALWLKSILKYWDVVLSLFTKDMSLTPKWQVYTVCKSSQKKKKKKKKKKKI